MRLGLVEIKDGWSVTRCHYQDMRGATLLSGHQNSSKPLLVENRKWTDTSKIIAESTGVRFRNYKMTHYDFFNEWRKS